MLANNIHYKIIDIEKNTYIIQNHILNPIILSMKFQFPNNGEILFIENKLYEIKAILNTQAYNIFVKTEERKDNDCLG